MIMDYGTNWIQEFWVYKFLTFTFFFSLSELFRNIDSTWEKTKEEGKEYLRAWQQNEPAGSESWLDHLLMMWQMEKLIMLSVPQFPPLLNMYINSIYYLERLIWDEFVKSRKREWCLVYPNNKKY